MKRIVLTFGLISGVLLSGMMIAMMPFIDQIGMDHGMVIGYTTMVLAFLLVFFGIRSYRETVGDGRISFGRALAVGFLIMGIASVCYVVTWEIVYFNFLHDFGDKYAAYVIEKARAAGASADEIARQTEEMNKFKVMYDNPLYNAAFTFLEPLPVGVPMTLISAAILRKRRRKELSA
ncbi:MAG TPA: DUF4199 domain-containing protein [Pyrinomonadaceae bacterium]|nr:DUF4199 domain-containing protein [Pyrinomonadaceae bacterium]